MSEQVSELRGFNYLTILKTPYEKLYRLIYSNTVRYFKIRDDGTLLLLESTGSVMSGDILKPLYEKIKVYERIFARSLEYENLDYFLRIDEVRFLLQELEMNQPDLENRLYDRLFPHVDYQIRRGFYQPLILPRILVQNEFVYNYLMTNIGHPDGSENYFNRMKIMIQQLSEYTQYVEIKNYFEIIQALLIFVNECRISTKNVVIKSHDSACILISGFTTIGENNYRLLVRGKLENNEETTIIELDNKMIARLISIYNTLLE